MELELFWQKNLKHIRKKRNLSQSALAKKIGVDRSMISYWENEKSDIGVINAYKLSEALNIDLHSFVGMDLNFDNAKPTVISETDNNIEIPVLGKIHAGKSVEAQEDIINYIDIPRSWVKNSKCYGLLIDGDCMSPKYNSGEIVIFKQQENFESGQDCAVMINGNFEATFKKVIKTETGFILQPYNEKYETKIYTKEDILNMPIKIMGVAFKKFGDID